MILVLASCNCASSMSHCVLNKLIPHSWRYLEGGHFFVHYSHRWLTIRVFVKLFFWLAPRPVHYCIPYILRCQLHRQRVLLVLHLYYRLQRGKTIICYTRKAELEFSSVSFVWCVPHAAQNAKTTQEIRWPIMATTFFDYLGDIYLHLPREYSCALITSLELCCYKRPEISWVPQMGIWMQFISSVCYLVDGMQRLVDWLELN